MGIFNNREIAIIIWLALLLLVFAVKKPDVLKSFCGIIVDFFNYKILIPYVLAVTYTLIGVYVLFKIGAWKTEQLKDTLLWLFFTIISIILSTNKARENKKFFRDAVRENLKLSIIIEFITGLYTFSIIAELCIVFLAVSISLLQTVAGKDEKYAGIQKLFNAIIIAIGCLILWHTFKEIKTHITEFASYQTLRDFALSPFLAIWILPYIYFLALYMTYEEGFNMIGMRIKDQALVRFTKRNSLFHFNLNTQGFKRWRSGLFIGSVDTKQDVINSIKQIRRLQKIEKNPPHINPELGWSPYVAKDFLAKNGIPTRYYQNTFDDEWSASSDYIKLDKEFMANSVMYSIQGNETITQKLYLTVDINVPEREEEAIAKFIGYADTLHFAAMKKELPNSIQEAILKSRNKILDQSPVTLTVRKSNWLDSTKYSLEFNIEHK
ncbi:MAG: hypothetical protein V4561_10210 [Bacteroidota bacterium]